MSTLLPAVQERIQAVVQGERLSQIEAHSVFESLSNGLVPDVTISALLAALRARGETAAEVAGAAQAFRAAAVPFPHTGLDLIDIVGTGGDGHHTINISTAAGLVGASMGLFVAKHGNRSVSSVTGSADVITALGIPIELEPGSAAEAVKQDHFCFLFAQRYHPAMRYVAPIRNILATPTVFNLLGPLVNPAPLAYQVMGVANPEVLDMIAQTLACLGRKKALVVHGSGVDEIALHGPTEIREIDRNGIRTYTVTPESLGMHTWTLQDLVGGDSATNAQALNAVFEGNGTQAHEETVAVNTGAMLYTAGQAASIAEGAQAALEHIQRGAVADHLATMRK
ncbi:anthranilate phosphoribosyltransferase [Stomatohabitans albus]|uniref:anthranilate phosphoribosyltransferase n=1 Tax=Stomatohabitans albus TaxID=3110766 RepID=UPI00300DB517